MDTLQVLISKLCECGQTGQHRLHGCSSNSTAAAQTAQLQAKQASLSAHGNSLSKQEMGKTGTALVRTKDPQQEPCTHSLPKTPTAHDAASENGEAFKNLEKHL